MRFDFQRLFVRASRLELKVWRINAGLTRRRYSAMRSRGRKDFLAGGDGVEGD